MRKKMVLIVFFIISMAKISYAQSTETHSVKVSDGGTTSIEIGDSVTFIERGILELIDLGLLIDLSTSNIDLIIRMECTSAPVGVDKSDYLQEKKLTITMMIDFLDALINNNPLPDLIGFNDLVFDEYEGAYEFSISSYDSPFGSLVNLVELEDFIIDVVPEGTLSLKNVENTPEFSVFAKDGFVTVNNANDSAVTGMTVYSISGAQVFASNAAVASIDLSTVANGVYILTVQEGASVTTKKFIKS